MLKLKLKIAPQTNVIQLYIWVWYSVVLGANTVPCSNVNKIWEFPGSLSLIMKDPISMKAMICAYHLISSDHYSRIATTSIHVIVYTEMNYHTQTVSAVDFITDMSAKPIRTGMKS